MNKKSILIVSILYCLSFSLAIADINAEKDNKLEYYADWICDHTEINNHLSDKICKEYAAEIVNVAENESLAPSLLLGLIYTESKFDHLAKSKFGAIGLTQVIPKYHKDIVQGKNLRNPKISIAIGAKVLKKYLVLSKNNLRKALGHYLGGAKKANKIYSTKVMSVAYNLRINANKYSNYKEMNKDLNEMIIAYNDSGG